MSTKWPEATEVLESLGTSLEDMKRTAKAVFPCLTEVCQAFDQYGKANSRAARGLLTNLQGLDSGSAGFLCGPLLSLAKDREEVGAAIDGQFAGLVADIANADYYDEAGTLRKAISEEIQTSSKELSSLKTIHEKAQAKYEKYLKEMESAISAEEKAKTDPASSYQLSTTQKFADKTRESQIQTHESIKALNDARQKLNAKITSFEATIQSAQNRFLAFDQKALHGVYQSYTLFLSILKTLIATTQTSSDQRSKRVEQLAATALDLSQGRTEPESQRSGDKFNADYLAKKLDVRLHGLEERSKAVKLMKTFVGDAGSAEETLSKALMKATTGYASQAQYLMQKLGSNQAWKEMMTLLGVIAGIHSERASAHTGDAQTQLNAIAAQQGVMIIALREAGHQPIKEHIEVEEDSSKKLEKAQMKSEGVQLSESHLEIAAKRLESASKAEDQLNSIIEENEKDESVNLEMVKNLLERLFALDTEMKVKYGESVKTVEATLGTIDIRSDSVSRPAFKLTTEQPLALIPNIELPVEEEKEDSLMAKFGLPPDTVVISTHACALQQKILLQGTMHLTATHVCFKSKFNAQTLIGRDTIVTIPIKDIVRVEKRTIGFVFNNGIGIVMAETEMVFGSFLKREAVIAAIESLKSALSDPKAETSAPEVTPAAPSAVPSPAVHDATQTVTPAATPAVPIEPVTVESSTLSREAFKDRMFPDEQLNLSLFKSEVVFSGSAQEVFLTFFSTADFWAKYLTPRGDANIEITDWTPSPAGCYGQGKWGDISTRKITYKHPVKEKIPFMPSTCDCKEDWSLYCLSAKEFVVESAVTVSGVPMSDAFIVKMRWVVTQTDKTCVEVQYGVHFIKDTWFKSKIQNNSVSEATEALNSVWIPLALSTWNDRKPAIPVKSETREGVDRGSLDGKTIPDGQLKLKMFKEEVAFSGSAKDVFACFFATDEFWLKYLSPRGDTDIVITEWAPRPPTYFSELSTEKWPESSSRKLTYTHPVREKMPFVPSTCKCTEDWTVFWLSRKAFLVDCQVVVSGVPMSDVFVVKMRWEIEESTETKLEVKYGVHFVKDSWFKGKIENNSVSEATEALNQFWIPIAKKAWGEFLDSKSKPALEPLAAEAAPLAPTPPEESKAPPKPVVPSAEVPIKPIAAPTTNRDPFIWVLFALAFFLLFQIYQLNARLSFLESQFSSNS